MNKACPVVLRERNGVLQILAFEHPLAGKQIVKGTIEPNESLESACIRELAEESGLEAEVLSSLSIWESEFDGQVWGFCLMKLSKEAPDKFKYFTLDDGGHYFEFFWQPLRSELSINWHSLFKGAIAHINKELLEKAR